MPLDFEKSSVFDLQGHRGARGLMPENTVPAFLCALDLGVVTLEMDVVISGDEQVVVSHEPWFSSVTASLPSGAPVPEEREHEFRLYEMTYEEIARFDVGRRGHPAFPEQKRQPAVKPLLRTVIQAAEAHVEQTGRLPVHYSVETKSLPGWEGRFHPDPETFTRLVYEVLAEEDVTGRSILQSFDPRTLQVARQLDPALRLSLLVGLDAEQDLAGHIEQLGFAPSIYSPDHRAVDTALIKEVHRSRMKVIPWTVNTLTEMKRLKALGVDGLITDYPDRGRQMLSS